MEKRTDTTYTLTCGLSITVTHQGETTVWRIPPYPKDSFDYLKLDTFEDFQLFVNEMADIVRDHGA